MKMLSKADLLEATRLTREGRLKEATAILRGMSPGTAAAHSRADAGKAMPPILDMEPPSDKGGAWTSPRSGEAASSDSPGAIDPSLVPEALRDFLGRMGQQSAMPGLDGLKRSEARVPTPSLPDGARFDEFNYAEGRESRPYKLYVPSGYAGEPLPLVVMLHGCTQSPDDFAAGTRMNELGEEQTFLVAYPAQIKSANASKCWNWFNATDQKRDRGEPSLIAGITRRIMDDFPVDPRRVYVAGLSAGGAAAAIMGANYPDLYAAIGVHSGLACGAASDMPSAFAAMRSGGSHRGGSSTGGIGDTVPTIVFHGDRDRTVHPVNGDQVIAQSKPRADLHTSVSHGQAAGGIGYTRTVQVDGSERAMLEQWVLHGAGHAWSGGSPSGSYTEPRGPDASREMVRFFLEHAREIAPA